MNDKCDICKQVFTGKQITSGMLFENIILQEKTYSFCFNCVNKSVVSTSFNNPDVVNDLISKTEK